MSQAKKEFPLSDSLGPIAETQKENPVFAEGKPRMSMGPIADEAPIPKFGPIGTEHIDRLKSLPVNVQDHAEQRYMIPGHLLAKAQRIKDATNDPRAVVDIARDLDPSAVLPVDLPSPSVPCPSHEAIVALRTQIIAFMQAHADTSVKLRFTKDQLLALEEICRSALS